MSFDATQLLIFGSIATFGIWMWRFASLQEQTAREMRAAASRRLARAMGTQFWKQGNPYQGEIAYELDIDPNWIVHTLHWANAQVEIFSFQEVRHGSKGRIYYNTWIGYRFGRLSFPKFNLSPKRLVHSILRGWRRRVSLSGQLEFTERYLLSGKDVAAIEQLFTPSRCVAILSVPWPPTVRIKGGGHWLFASHERWLYSTSESDSEAAVLKETNDLLLLFKETLPLAEALTDSKLVKHSQQYDSLSQSTSLNKKRHWWDPAALLFLGLAIVILILVLVVFGGELWELFDKSILKTETRRFMFAIIFLAMLWAGGELLIRSYRHMKQRAAARLET